MTIASLRSLSLALTAINCAETNQSNFLLHLVMQSATASTALPTCSHWACQLPLRRGSDGWFALVVRSDAMECVNRVMASLQAQGFIKVFLAMLMNATKVYKPTDHSRNASLG